MPIPVRGLRTIRTLAGRVDRLFVPHRAHMQIVCLEIEKARRVAERTTATRRLAELDTRLREIEDEETILFQRLTEANREGRLDLSGTATRLAPRRTAGGFRIKY